MYFENENRLQNHAEFKELSPTLTELDGNAIFVIVKNEEGYHIVEGHHEYYSLKLTKEVCKDLAELFSKIAERID